MNPRILFFDTERAPPIWWAWESSKPQFLNYSQLIQNGFFTSVQWQWEWEAKPSAFSLADKPKYFRENPTCDRHVVEKALELVSESDILVAHNGKRFDWRHLKARAMFHRLKPPRKPYIIDTLTEARKSAFPSNRLGDLAKFLKIAEKETNQAECGKIITGPMKQRLEHIELQTKYGIKDIPPLKELYYILRPFMDNHPNMTTYAGVACCPTCQSDNFINRGSGPISGGLIRKQYECKNCGKRFKGAIEKRPVFK